jgi:hypothetical protein
MTAIRIDLPDEQAAVLKEKLSARGLSVEGWFKQLAEEEAHRRATRSLREAVDRILELQKHVEPDPERWTVKDYINYGRP